MNYWQLTLRDGDKLLVKPDLVAEVRRRLETRELLHTPTRTIPHNEVKDFSETDKPYIDKKRQLQEGLVEDAARAFNEPLLMKEVVIAKWVKKLVTKQSWDKHYRAIPAYRMLQDDGSRVWVAFKCPIHQINRQTVYEMTPDEIKALGKP